MTEPHVTGDNRQDEDHPAPTSEDQEENMQQNSLVQPMNFYNQLPDENQLQDQEQYPNQQNQPPQQNYSQLKHKSKSPKKYRYQPKKHDKFRSRDIEYANEALLQRMVKIVNVSLIIYNMVF